MNAGADFLSPGGEMAAWIGMVGEAAFRGTLLLLASFLISLALRRGSAASRHLVWASCLCLLLVLPILAQIAPAVPAPGIPQSWSTAWEEVVDIASSQVAGLLGGGDRPVQPTAATIVAGSLGPDGAGAVAATTAHLDVVLMQAKPGWGATTWLAAIWITGVVMVLGWLAVGLWLRWSLSRRAQVVRAGPWVENVRGIAAQLGIRRDLVLLRGEEDAVPMTWGSLRPVVYLPPGADDWRAGQRRSVLLHELAHVRRWDSLTRSVSQIACAIFWFHPLAWYAAHRLLREQERACDDVVLLAGAAPDEYATTLLTLARHYRRRRPAVVGALALARRSTLENRLISILDPRRKRLTMSRTHRFVLLTTFIAVVVPLASLQPAPAEPAVASAQPGISSSGGQEVSSASEQDPETSSAEEHIPVQMIIKGVVHLGSSLDEIEVGPGGRFVIQEIQSVDEHLELDSADPEHGRRLEITADAEGNVERAWTVDGATRSIDDDARAWVDGILGRLDDAHVEFSPVGSDETRTLIFAGEHLAMVGEAHASAGASSHGVIAITEGDRVIHLKPGMVWTTEEGEEGKKIELHLSEPHVAGEGRTIELHLAKPFVHGEGGEWTIHVDDPDLLLHKEELGESIVLELKRAEGDDESFTIVAPRLKVLGEGDERKVVVVVPKGELGEQEISAVVVKPKLKIIEEAGEAHAVVVVEPRIIAEAQVHPRVHVEIVDEPHVIVDVRTDEHSEHTITMDIDDEDSHMTVRMRGEVDLGETVDEIEVGEGGELSIDERDADGVIRQLSIRPGPDDDLIFEFFVDGAERPFDAAARAWLQAVLDRIEH